MGARISGASYGGSLPSATGHIAGEALVLDATGAAAWRDPMKESEDVDECFSKQGSIYSQDVNGAGAAVTDMQGEDNHPGMVQLATGTTATGRAAYSAHANNMVALVGPSGVAAFGHIFTFRVPILSVVAEEFSARFGFWDTFTGDAVDGVYLEYDRLTNGDDNLRAKSAANSVRTVTATGVALVAGAWESWLVTFNAGPASFYRRVAGAWSLVTSFSTNIPGTARAFSFGAMMVKSAGLTSRVIDIDLMRYRQEGISR